MRSESISEGRRRPRHPPSTCCGSGKKKNPVHSHRSIHKPMKRSGGPPLLLTLHTTPRRYRSAQGIRRCCTVGYNHPRVQSDRKARCRLGQRRRCNGRWPSFGRHRGSVGRSFSNRDHETRPHRRRDDDYEGTDVIVIFRLLARTPMKTESLRPLMPPRPRVAAAARPARLFAGLISCFGADRLPATARFSALKEGYAGVSRRNSAGIPPLGGPNRAVHQPSCAQG